MERIAQQISVVIPVYQAERFIEKAVRSACEQKCVLEILLIEDGSVDNSLKICENLANIYNPRVKLYQHQDRQNHGAGASRNLGIKMARSEFIAFLDADDYYLPGRFKGDIEILLENPAVDGVYNALGNHIYDESELSRIHGDLTTVTYPIPHHNLFEEMTPIGSSGYFSGDTLTVRTSIFDKVGLFDERLELSQDTHMWIKMAAKANLRSGIIDLPVAMRGVHQNNRVKNRDKRLYFRPILFASLITWSKNNSISKTRIEMLWDCLYNSYIRLINTKSNNLTLNKIKILRFLILKGMCHPYLFWLGNYRYSYFKLLRGSESRS